jgi:hypothetical protein
MSELQEIDVYLDAYGNVKVEIRGVKGNKCLEITKELEQHLGQQLIDRELTDDYYLDNQQESELPQVDSNYLK